MKLLRILGSVNPVSNLVSLVKVLPSVNPVLSAIISMLMEVVRPSVKQAKAIILAPMVSIALNALMK